MSFNINWNQSIANSINSELMGINSSSVYSQREYALRLINEYKVSVTNIKKDLEKDNSKIQSLRNRLDGYINELKNINFNKNQEKDKNISILNKVENDLNNTKNKKKIVSDEKNKLEGERTSLNKELSNIPKGHFEEITEIDSQGKVTKKKSLG